MAKRSSQTDFDAFLRQFQADQRRCTDADVRGRHSQYVKVTDENQTVAFYVKRAEMAFPEGFLAFDTDEDLATISVHSRPEVVEWVAKFYAYKDFQKSIPPEAMERFPLPPEVAVEVLYVAHLLESGTAARQGK